MRVRSGDSRQPAAVAGRLGNHENVRPRRKRTVALLDLSRRGNGLSTGMSDALIQDIINSLTETWI